MEVTCECILTKDRLHNIFSLILTTVFLTWHVNTPQLSPSICTGTSCRINGCSPLLKVYTLDLIHVVSVTNVQPHQLWTSTHPTGIYILFCSCTRQWWISKGLVWFVYYCDLQDTIKCTLYLKVRTSLESLTNPFMGSHCSRYLSCMFISYGKVVKHDSCPSKMFKHFTYQDCPVGLLLVCQCYDPITFK